MRNILLSCLLLFLATENALACPELFKTEMRQLHSEKMVNLCSLVEGNAVLVVNTASHCGFTSQFKGLETLHQSYKDKGLVVLGFASDDFKQEADSEAEAATICYKNYGVSFTMLAPSHVKGSDANTVFKQINQQASEPAWNFNKYLLDRQGKVVKSFGSKTSPSSEELKTAIESVL